VSKNLRYPWSPVDNATAESFTVDGRRPAFHVAPSTADDMAEVLRAATSADLAVVPYGAGSKQSLGNPPRRYDLALDTRRLSGIIEYRPDDLVVVALAGTPLARLQGEATTHGQWFALDPTHASVATLGGTLATGASGPHRLRYGTSRDLVLGMCVAYADGTLAWAGAKVVKSVAGYDLHKAHVGALGTLGVIVEVALRLHPLPRVRRTLVCAGAGVDALAALVADLAHRPLGLAALELLNAAAARRLLGADAPGSHGYALLILCEGDGALVARQADVASRAAGVRGLRTDEVAADGRAAALAARLADLPMPPHAEAIVLKITVPPGDTCIALERVVAVLASHDPNVEAHAHAASGVIQVVLPRPPRDGAGVIGSLRDMAHVWGGRLVVLACPPAFKASVDMWGPVQAARLMRGLKAAFDPTGMLNPGRFVERL
jgi:glycolate oxidase FAD binding subunit